MTYIGTAVFKDFDSYLDWYSNLTKETAGDFSNIVKERHWKTNSSDPIGYRTSTLFDNYWYYREININSLRDFKVMVENYNLPIYVSEWHENLYAYIYLGNPEKGFIVPTPEKYLELVPKKNYADMTPAQVQAALCMGTGAAEMNIVPKEAASSLTVNGVTDQKTKCEESLQQLSREMEDVKQAKSEGLAELQAQIKKMQDELAQKQAILMAELEEKKAEMEAMKERLENQIYLLDSQIYAIRCFAGEVVNFTQLRTGQKASDSEPIVIYQKLHFLDEDLGRMASLYELQWNDISLFEDFLRHSPVALENFTPNNRCISLVRLSRDATTIGRNHEIPWANLLERYEYYHGKTVGILVRNGDNLYLGWTDETRVHIQDDLLVGRVVTETEPAPQKALSKWDQERLEKEAKENKRKLLDAMISRSFVYNILQGIVEHSSILPLPKGITLGKESQYVIYAVADKWLSDNRFGSFNEIIERCNKNITKGDHVLTVQKLVAQQYNYGTGRWNYRENIRGRGYNCRTHDVEADDCTIYPVNLIEYDKPIERVRYRYPDRLTLSRPDSEKEWHYCIIDKASVDSLSEESEIVEEFVVHPRHIFISLKKYYSDYDARANFEIYDGEFINLTYMNSVWLEWVITNKALGGWRVGSVNVNYAFAIRYLKKAMDFIRKREEREKEILNAFDSRICADPEWPLKLSEWKLEVGVREVTPYQAKRFVKWLNAKQDIA